MPALSLDRIRSEPFPWPVLRWLGPWSFNTFIGFGEEHRGDVDQPLFMAMRLAFKPAHWLEFGMSRSAQFCGEDRECNVGTFGRMLIGQDNRGIRGASSDPAKEPGNQMAGFDVRLVSPFKPLPVAIYGQEIGEDNSSTGIPERYLGLFGAELWFMLDSGSVMRGHVEYANTKAKWYQLRDNFDVAYRNGVFFAGYRYRDRNIGHTADSDSETTSVALSLTTTGGDRWAMLLRRAALDRGGVADPFNLVTSGPGRYRSLQLDWSRSMHGGSTLAVQLGHERQRDGDGLAKGMFGFARMQWRLR
jgi:hypothetical protein